MLPRVFNRDITNLESYQLIWLDTNPNKTDEDMIMTLARFREVIKRTEGTTTFLVCSNSLDEPNLSQIYDLKNVCTIYVYCSNKEQHPK